MKSVHPTLRKGSKKSRKGQKVRFQVLPMRDIERCKRWLREVNNPTIGEDSRIEMIKGKTICNLYFKLEDYDRNLFGMTRHTLKQTAVPSVFTVGPFPDDQQASASNAPPAKRTRLQVRLS